MKPRLRLLKIFAIALLFASAAHAQLTEFTYQGKLLEGGAPANTPHDLEFRLFDSEAAGSQVGGTISRPDTPVVSGVFTVLLDFGAVYGQGGRWLEIAVSPAGANTFTTLSPRTKIAAVPQAAFSASAASLDCAECIDGEQIDVRTRDNRRFTTVQPGGTDVVPDLRAHDVVINVEPQEKSFLGTLTFYMLPMLLGTRDLPFPRLSAFGFWSFLIGGVFVAGSIFFDAAPEGGWFMYPPLTTEYQEGVGADIWLLGLTFIEIASIAAAVELIVGVLKTRPPGMRINLIPLYAWYILVVAVMILFAFPPLIAGDILMELERLLDWPFFDPARGGDPLGRVGGGIEARVRRRIVTHDRLPGLERVEPRAGGVLRMDSCRPPQGRELPLTPIAAANRRSC